MVRSILKNYTGAVLGVTYILCQSVCFADEATSSTVQTSTPAGSASTTVNSKTNATGSSTAVNHTTSTPGSVQSHTYRAKAGPNGAKVSSTKTAVQGNADGGVTSSRQHESHAVGAAGSVHHKSDASTTVSPDGSASTVKHEAIKTTP